MGLFLILPLITQIANAQNTSKPYMDMDRTLEMEYSSAAWNRDSKKIDKAKVFLRDSATGEVIPMELTETSPTSGVFRGKSKLTFTQSKKFLSPEVYIAPKSVWQDPQATQKVQSLIEKGSLFRSPFVLKPTDAATQSINVFDSREQAFTHFEGYKKLLSEKRQMEQAALEAEESAAREAEKKRLKELADQMEKQRLDLLEAEQKRKEELLKQQALLDEKTKKERKDQAKKLAEEALALYQIENFLEAEKKFNKAVELDPENLDYYFQYGVTLYKLKKYNQSIVVLKMGSSGKFDPTEKDYYIGLNYLRLNERVESKKSFEKVIAVKDHKLAPYAAFFLGVILFQTEKYDDAQKNFEFVLDKSEDPEIDRQSETYIDQIANIKQFLLLKSNRWSFYFNIGLMYDSNILSTSTGTATDKAGWRLLYGSSLQYRILYLEKTEWAAKVLISDINSIMGNNFTYNDTLQRYDPMLTQFSLPFIRRGSLFSKPFQWTLTPAYEFNYMDVDGTPNTGVGTQSYALRNRELITNSLSVKSDQTFVMDELWFSNYSLEYRRDLSFSSVNDEERQTANKYIFGTTQTFYKNPKRNRGQIYDFSYSQNQAIGENQRYNKYDLGWTYTAPAWGSNTWNVRLGGASSAYPNHLTGRRDTEYSLAGGLRMPISKFWISNLLTSYSNVSSTLEGSSFSKYFIFSQFEYSTQF